MSATYRTRSARPFTSGFHMVRTLSAFLVSTASLLGAASAPLTEIYPGVWRVTFGEPEAITPVKTRHYAPQDFGLGALPAVAEPPVSVSAEVTPRGALVRVPLAPDELVYGLGLQLKSFQQRSTKKKLRVNADPAMDTGDSHAPVPFYVTTRGYGVFVDTARYATFYLGNKVPVPPTPREAPLEAKNDGWNGVPPYVQKGFGAASEVLIEVPSPARGVDVYVFAGPSLRAAVQRYNLFSGGGALPPRWGLGFWYRGDTDYSQADALALADEFRARKVPCDVLGLEPHWQTHSYSSSYTWSDRFPNPAEMLAQLTREGFRVNLWEQAFVHPSSPIYRALHDKAGDYEVWGGLVPDFLEPEARKVFAEHHEKAFAALGISGFKADECDNSDFTGNWSFPELTQFPSGADGEQMHSLFGLRYQDALQQVFEARRQRTYGLVRCSGALAAPSPYVLYSDLYDHREFVHAIPQASFSGLLWTPEVRDAATPEELVRRLQAVVFSPLAMINAWYLKHPPWKQVNRRANAAGEFVDDWQQIEATCRATIELRMKFVPYLHAAFVRYRREGLPPVRALLMDYPDDPQVANLDDEYLFGDDVLVAPIVVGRRAEGAAGATSASLRDARRTVYLPAGDWYDFWTGKKQAGNARIDVTAPLDRIPLFVRAGAVLPLATPTLHTEDAASWRLSVMVYGDGSRGARLYEDDGSYEPTLPEVRLSWDASSGKGATVRSAPAGARAYSVVDWRVVK